MSETETVIKALGAPKKEDVVCLDAGKKDSKTYKELCDIECFGARALISTSVIDNGINIKDKNLKHVVIQSLDPVSMIQMVGRKRLLPGEMVHVYIMVPSTEKQYVSELNTIKRLRRCIEDAKKSGIALPNWGEMPEDEQKLFYFQYGSMPNEYQIVYNLFAELKLRFDLGRVEELKKKFQYSGKSGAAKEMLSWFKGAPDYSENIWIVESQISTAEQLEEYVKNCIEIKKLIGELYFR